MFRKKMVPIEEREPFSKCFSKKKKRLETVPFCQKWHHFGSLGEPFFNKESLETAPLGHTKIGQPFKREPFPTFFWKTAPYHLKGHYFSAPVALYLYRKCTGKQCPFGKWHQNGVPKRPVLRTVKLCPKWAVLVPLIFLSDFLLLTAKKMCPFAFYAQVLFTEWSVSCNNK